MILLLSDSYSVLKKEKREVTPVYYDRYHERDELMRFDLYIVTQSRPRVHIFVLLDITLFAFDFSLGFPSTNIIDIKLHHTDVVASICVRLTPNCGSFYQVAFIHPTISCTDIGKFYLNGWFTL